MAGAHTRDPASALKSLHLVSLAQEKVEWQRMLCLGPGMLTQYLPWSPQAGRMRATLVPRGHSLRPSCSCTSGAKGKVGPLAGQTTHPHGLKVHL